MPGVWDVFGGHIEPGEQPHQALVRELREELGITALRWSYRHTLHFADPALDTDVELWWYIVTGWEGTPINVQPHEHDILAWFTYADAVQLSLADPSYPALFAQALCEDADDRKEP